MLIWVGAHHINSNMNVGLLIALLLASLLSIHLLTQPQPSLDDFAQWKLQFKVSFQCSHQELYRRNIFYTNLAKITSHNADPTQTYQMGLTQFAIYTQNQFSQKFLSQLPPVEEAPPIVGVSSDAIDWQDQGAVSRVPNQDACGSAAIYSTLGGVQGLHFVAKRQLESYSKNQLVDCVYGCSGSVPDKGYAWYKTHFCTEDEYQAAGGPGSCNSSPCKFKISNYNKARDCGALAQQLQRQPISVAVDATNWSLYTGGVLGNCRSSLNHMVLLVGMTSSYWRCRNSWGTSWGEKGYIRLQRGNTCGICNFALYPTTN